MRLPDIVFAKDGLLNVYTTAGLSRQPHLSSLTCADVGEHGSEINDDLIDFDAMMDVLTRNRLTKESAQAERIDMSRVSSDAKHRPRSVEVKVKTRYLVTELGTRFIEDCRPPQKS
jgi:hypothetical protein